MPKQKLFWNILAKYNMVVFILKRRYFTVFSPGFFEGVVGGEASIRARRFGEMLEATNLLLLLLYLAFVFIATPLAKR